MSFPGLLTLNAGSSSLKFALFEWAPAGRRLLAGTLGRIGLANPELSLHTPPSTESTRRAVTAATHAEALELVLEEVRRAAPSLELRAVGHRVLHGGERYCAPHPIDDALLAELVRLEPLGPEHMPAQISLIRSIRKRARSLPQVACFDTAFHSTLPRVARLLPIPRRFQEAGVRRYGFHGLSYEYVLEELARRGCTAARQGRVLVSHLGNGASMAAVRDGRCIDTSMSFTPTAGLVMGRRSGDLDPGLVAYLARTEGMTPDQFHELVNHRSGLLGVSGISSDMRELLPLEGSDSRAADAVALFCHQARKFAGAFAAALGGLDAWVFCGGIGENQPSIRERICEGLRFAGLRLDPGANGRNAPLVSATGSSVEVHVIRTDEEIMIARSVCRVVDPDDALPPASL
jgi:acetate kinase